MFYEALNSDGYLIIGKTETMHEGMSKKFEMVSLCERIFKEGRLILFGRTVDRTYDNRAVACVEPHVPAVVSAVFFRHDLYAFSGGGSSSSLLLRSLPNFKNSDLKKSSALPIFATISFDRCLSLPYPLKYVYCAVCEPQRVQVSIRVIRRVSEKDVDDPSYLILPVVEADDYT